MATDDKNESGTGRPFQLRPSMLSGSGFGSPFTSGTVGQKLNKEFMLRPSSLSSAADKIADNKITDTGLDTRKRQLSGSEDKETNEEEPIKKSKVTTEESKPQHEPNIKLTDDIAKPTGIGSFGFAPDAKSNSVENNNGLTSTSTNKNYFSQTIGPNDKVSFVFGSGGTANSVGFNAFKKDDTTEQGSEKPCEETEADDKAFDRVASREKLLESATEYEKTHNNRQHYEEVEQFTGEEGEQHVLQIFCKLHVFDKVKKNWLEKGRGTLKLNDKCQTEGCFQSRIVFRTHGTNLVQLNTKVYPEMCCEKVKDKSVRISAVDPETKEVKVYLITTSLKDAPQAFTAIDRRISALKRGRTNTPKEGNENEGNENSNDFKNTNSDEDSNSETEESNQRLGSTKAKTQTVVQNDTT